jgi:hypothetical protein
MRPCWTEIWDSLLTDLVYTVVNAAALSMICIVH